MLLEYAASVQNAGKKVYYILRRELMLSETMTRRLKKAGAILVDGRDKPVAATVTFVSPEAEYAPPVIYSSQSRAKLVFRVEAAPDPGQAPLNPGQPVDVRLGAGG